ncbi:MAG: hypothetical protein AAF907_18445, partial [Planctomycetota bacterium]
MPLTVSRGNQERRRSGPAEVNRRAAQRTIRRQFGSLHLESAIMSLHVGEALVGEGNEVAHI